MSELSLTETESVVIEPKNKKFDIVIDANYGEESEKVCLPILREKFDNYLMKNENKYAIFDFIGNTHLIELKTRRYDSTKYPDTMIGVNKIKYAINSTGRKVIFCFKFDDGLFYWEFSKERLGVDLELRLGGRIDRGRDERRPYYFIKTSSLTKIE